MSALDPSSWAPVPLVDILSGDHIAPEPSILARTDGRCLIYPGRLHAINAEPEALKSWLALQACAERLSAGECVLYIDFEENAPAIVHRLLQLGQEPDAILQRFVYVRPYEPLDVAPVELNHLRDYEATLAVIDGVTDAFSCQGLSPLANDDVAAWLDLLPRLRGRWRGERRRSLSPLLGSARNGGMSALATALLAELDEAALVELAERLRPYLTAGESPEPDGWLRGAEQIAAHIAAPPSRVYALLSAGRIPVERDGSALVARKSDLDRWLAAGGAKRP